MKGSGKREFELPCILITKDLGRILDSDNQYLVMAQGDEVFLEFEKPPALEDGWTRQVYVRAEGYYISSK